MLRWVRRGHDAQGLTHRVVVVTEHLLTVALAQGPRGVLAPGAGRGRGESRLQGEDSVT